MSDAPLSALVAGLDGRAPPDAVRDLVARLARTLRDLLHPDHRAAGVVSKPSLDGAALLAALGPWKAATGGVWLVGVGRVLADDDDPDDLALGTEEALGVPVRKVWQRVAAAGAAWRVVVLDVPEEHAAALRALDWGRCAVLAIGPGVAAKLEASLLPEAAGPVTAAGVAAALGGRSDAPDVILNVRQAGDAAAAPDELARVRYLQGLRAECGLLALASAVGGDPDAEWSPQQPRSLADVYVPLATRGRDDERAEVRRRLFEPPPEPLTVHDRVAAHRCVFLVGDPGSGKTSFLKRLAAQLCDVGLGDVAPIAGLPADPLPVLFELRAFEGTPSPPALLRQATAGLRCAETDDPLPATVVAAAREAGRLVLLFDGLDEVPAAGKLDAPQRRKAMAAALTKLATVEGSGLPMVVTCRPAAAQEGATPTGPFQRFDLQALEDHEIFRIAQNWLTLRETTRDQAEPLARALVADLRSHPAVYALAGSPLTLGMICVVLYRRDGRLPRDRNDLYELLVELLLSDRGRASNELVAQRRLWLTDLARAWWDAGGTREPDTALREDACIALLGRRGLAGDDARAELRFLDLRAGLLAWAGSHQSWRRYRFAHRSFAEFLVACRLTEDAGQTDLQTAGLDAGWREVALMYVAELARASSGSKEPAWRYVGHLLDRAECDREPWASRGAAARLAAECLAEWRDLPSAQAPAELGQRIDKLQDAFLDLETSRQIAVADRAAFWTAVGPHNRVVKEHDRWVDVPAGRFWFGAAPGDPEAFDEERRARTVLMSAFRIQAWPVTVEEFAVFVDGGGYEDHMLWSSWGWGWRTARTITCPCGWPTPGRPHHPITGVSWWEAEAYCKWLTRRLNRPVRLPTEAQWEYAARGPYVQGDTVQRYPWGWNDDPGRRAGVGSSTGSVAPGVFPAGRAWRGTWDQSGSVLEWCADDFDGTLPSGTRDPERPATAGGTRTLRGGSFGFLSQFLRVSYRFGVGDPQWQSGSFGFRCVLPKDP